ncbi:FHA domain-containing protein [Paracidovorax cattleyae]|uniref:FHA domain-containing protein n=1 Tax=Paracidovorax cattleyae TaxID=80868 RepID=UPI0018AFD9C5|nr:FHA domain-containing protein [Paracidovorax cattleyae]MBF9263281.1 FHA domain-containing protein [Paracidovorax cattleyae]
MDKVELRVIRHADEAVDRLWTAVFGVAGGTIGRGGQNKLVLSDSDAGVARVHAMVRIESEAAFIANLCERRSIFVAGAEVRSGEEVRLSVGDEVRIGPYVLHSVVPGSPFVAAAVPVPAVAPGSAQVPAPVPAPLVISSPPASEASGAFPVHVPSVAGAQGDGIPAALSLTAAVPVPAGIGLPAEAAAPTEDDDNPFAMLGRVEGPAIAAAPASPVTAPVAGPRQSLHRSLRPALSSRQCRPHPSRSRLPHPWEPRAACWDSPQLPPPFHLHRYPRLCLRDRVFPEMRGLLRRRTASLPLQRPGLSSFRRISICSRRTPARARRKRTPGVAGCRRRA